MSHVTISTPNAPTPTAPLVQGIRWESLVFVSGQLPRDPATGTITSTDIAGQARQALENVGAVLEAAGSSVAQCLKVTCYLTSIGDMPAFNEAYRAAFGDTLPTRTTVEVSALATGALIEIDAIATTNDGPGSAR